MSNLAKAQEIQIPLVLSISQVVEMTKLPDHFVRRLVLEKKVHFVKSGKKYLISVESLRNYLNGEF